MYDDLYAPEKTILDLNIFNLGIFCRIFFLLIFFDFFFLEMFVNKFTNLTAITYSKEEKKKQNKNSTPLAKFTIRNKEQSKLAQKSSRGFVCILKRNTKSLV